MTQNFSKYGVQKILDAWFFSEMWILDIPTWLPNLTKWYCLQQYSRYGKGKNCSWRTWKFSEIADKDAEISRTGLWLQSAQIGLCNRIILDPWDSIIFHRKVSLMKKSAPLSNVISLGGRIKKLWIARTDWLSEFHVREYIIKVLDKSRSDEIRGETVGH